VVEGPVRSISRSLLEILFRRRSMRRMGMRKKRRKRS
jgi:hypothetical protein